MTTLHIFFSEGFLPFHVTCTCRWVAWLPWSPHRESPLEGAFFIGFQAFVSLWPALASRAPYVFIISHTNTMKQWYSWSINITAYFHSLYSTLFIPLKWHIGWTSLMACPYVYCLLIQHGSQPAKRNTNFMIWWTSLAWINAESTLKMSSCYHSFWKYHWHFSNVDTKTDGAVLCTHTTFYQSNSLY